MSHVLIEEERWRFVMTSRTFKLATGALALVFVYTFVVAHGPATQAQEPEGNFGVGIPRTFVTKYLEFRARQLADARPHVMRVRLGFVKGVTRSFTALVGQMAVDLGTGTFDANLSGLTPGQTYGVWVVDRGEPDATSLVPDLPVRLATILATAPTAVLTGDLAGILPPGFTIDRFIVSRGALSSGDPLGVGTVNVFQKMFFRRLNLVDDSTGEVLHNETTTPPLFFALVPDLVAETDALIPVLPPLLGLAKISSSNVETSTSGGSSGNLAVDRLISQGATLFFKETFRGNGRTCGTCHPANNNFTIDPAFIATLPPNDPLFVAEFNPALAQLERRQLMRQFGLILENLDGLENPTTKFVMRGVPHTLGLQVSLQRPNSPTVPAEMTGWSGDGAPGTGSLREFALGAITQHFTKTLDRREGRDFKLASEHQLDAMEAFQLSLGRSEDFQLATIIFQDLDVEAGKELFVNGGTNPDFGGKCAGCHNNGGALLGGVNLNLNTNVEDAPLPARDVEPFPFDGGFGQAPVNPNGSIGNNAFNLTSVVEAADTAPFFHNNLSTTIEAAIDFYSSPPFNTPRQPSARFNFDAEQRDKIADFLRALNALQNIDVAVRELEAILANDGNPVKETNTRLRTALEDTEDAIAVLTQGAIFPTAVGKLDEARDLISQALGSSDPEQRRSLAQQAIAKLGAARSLVASPTP